ncbi:MAG: DUF4145 domain-containing protein [Pleomorphochaeta sp.]
MDEKRTKEKLLVGLGGAIGGIALGSILTSNLFKINNIDGVILKKFTQLEILLKIYQGNNNPARIKDLLKKNIISKEEQKELLHIVNIRNKIAHESKDIEELEKNKTIRLLDFYIKKLS